MDFALLIPSFRIQKNVAKELTTYFSNRSINLLGYIIKYHLL